MSIYVQHVQGSSSLLNRNQEPLQPDPAGLQPAPSHHHAQPDLCCLLSAASPAPTSLDYPGIGPEHSFLRDEGRAEYYAVTDDEALEAFQRLSELEGIIPALETSHAIAYLEVGRHMPPSIQQHEDGPWH